jgi:sister chromatid cohesion protein DCC1
VVQAFAVRALPKSPAERFAVLFAQRQRWTKDDIEPYLEARYAPRMRNACTLSVFAALQGVEEAGATAEGLLLQWCRASQATPDAPCFYSARSTC